MPLPGIDVRLARALSHPLRQRILTTLGARVMSPSDLAEELRVPLGDAAYHVKQLAQHDCVELVRTERRRGAVKHFYTAKRWLAVEDADWLALPGEERLELSARVLDEVVAQAREAQDAGRFADEGVHVSRTPLELDAQGIAELNALLRGVVEQALRIQTGSHARADGDDRERPRRRTLAVLHFDTG